MSLTQRLPLIFIIMALGGCRAHQPAMYKTEGSGLTRSTSQPTVDPKTKLSLDEIQPRVSLPLPATQPATKPSLEAIWFYAKARGEMAQNERLNAIHDYEAAIALDPYSAELRQALAEAYLGSANFNDASIAALEKAAAIQPDSLEVQLELGRQELAKGDNAAALLPLRRATLTTEYANGDDQAALTDFFLATALQHEGYDRAALDSYKQLIERIRSPGPTLRENPELNYLISRPDAIWIEVGGLNEKGGRLPEALKAFQSAVKTDPDNFELREHIVRLLASMHRPEAKQKAVELVKTFSARPESITLLREVCRDFGNEADAIGVMKQLHEQEPNNRLLLYALSDTLQQTGRGNESRQLLASAAKTNHYDFDLVIRLLKIDEHADDWRAAARLLIETSQARPDLLSRMPALWTRLMRPMTGRRVRLEDLLALEVPAQQTAVRDFWVATLAESDSRDQTAARALQESLTDAPAYAPAFRMKLDQMLAAPNPNELPAAEIAKIEKSDPAIAAELRGILFLHEKNFTEAQRMFDRALSLNPLSPELADERVDALLGQNHDQMAESALREIVDRWPAYEAAHLQLIGFYANHRRDDQTIKTLENWLVNDPSSTSAKLLQARFLLETHRADAAEPILDQLIAGECDNADTLGSLESLYAQQGRLGDLAKKLGDRYEKDPDNTVLLQAMVSIDLAQHRANDASRLLDTARIRFAADADALYFVSGLYSQLDQKQTAEDVLSQALKVDPANPSVCNDLGYNWVESGKNLDQAEQLIRSAVAAEPDNQAFLDSLGWALYKRGRFGEAVQYLQKASDGIRPDPVVLDHLGDALYRSNRKDDAGAQWKRANDRLDQMGATRDDLKQLKLQLGSKLEKLKQGTPVGVAPVIQASTDRDSTGI